MAENIKGDDALLPRLEREPPRRHPPPAPRMQEDWRCGKRTPSPKSAALSRPAASPPPLPSRHPGPRRAREPSHPPRAALEASPPPPSDDVTLGPAGSQVGSGSTASRTPFPPLPSPFQSRASKLLAAVGQCRPGAAFLGSPRPVSRRCWPLPAFPHSPPERRRRRLVVLRVLQSRRGCPYYPPPSGRHRAPAAPPAPLIRGCGGKKNPVFSSVVNHGGTTRSQVVVLHPPPPPPPAVLRRREERTERGPSSSHGSRGRDGIAFCSRSQAAGEGSARGGPEGGERPRGDPGCPVGGLATSGPFPDPKNRPFPPPKQQPGSTRFLRADAAAAATC
ncbi:uncharacterized protein LOC131200739 [Ahaetulla prasina]|uniref:uncharacterized protein LOC131200739 n=1 Tax=Ahaetulla prasina TaxID=499056 RepID=UPI00264868D9|nr:uncharacterized protein LOC131200739 [Ahaetulla prasina]